jgi:hypothetical protein
VMRTDDHASVSYLVEWYTPHLHGRPISDVVTCLRRWLATQPAAVQPVELRYALEIPDEAYAFVVFAADSAEAVTELCQGAGLPPDRVCAAVEAAGLADTE